jgi:signal transduction histidine kinase
MPEAQIDTVLTTPERRQELLLELEKIVSELNVHEERHELIREIDEAILRSTFSAQEVLDFIVEKCLSKTGSKHGQVVQYRHNSLTVLASTEASRVGDKPPLNHSLCGKAVVEGEDQHSADVSEIPPDQYVRYHEETRSELALLIKAKQSDRTLGVLDLERDELGPFDQKSIEFARLLAGQAAIAMTHAQTWSGVRILYELSTSLLSGNVTLEEGFQKILESILQEFDFEYGQILLTVGEEFVIIASSSKADIGLRPTPKTSVCGHYLITKRRRDILTIDNIQESEYGEFYLALLQAEGGRPMKSEMIVPLIENDRLIGALNIESPRIGIFSDFERNLLGVVGTLMAGAISATYARRTQTNERQIHAANLALTQLGHAAEKFVHRFNNSVGSARAKQFELREHLSQAQIPEIRDGVSVTNFISEVIEKLTEATDTLRDFSDSFNPGHARYQLEEMDTEVVARTALERVMKRYEAKQIDFQFENQLPSADQRTTKAVGGQYRCLLSEPVYEVIESVLENAAEAIIERKLRGSGWIKLALDLPDPFHVRMRIEDNGGGIPELDQPRVFEYGFTTKKSRQSQGIGLWFCDLYVRQRGGSISFLSKEGEGSVFEILFPTVLTELERP